jgi:D-galactarolactone cycloisomerase
MLSRIPLAGGENLSGFQAFDAAIAAGHLGVIQPDICKWGRISCCAAVARRAIAAGRRYCPRCLNSGIGLHAAAHVLTAVGGDGLLEHDAMENPLQAVLAHPLSPLVPAVSRRPTRQGLVSRPISWKPSHFWFTRAGIENNLDGKAHHSEPGALFIPRLRSSWSWHLAHFSIFAEVPHRQRCSRCQS